MVFALLLFSYKSSAAGGFLSTVTDFGAQVCQKKLGKEEGEREPICCKRMICAFGVGAAVGNVAGTWIAGHAAHRSAGQIAAAMAWTELAWLPLHITLLAGKADALEDNLPTVFGTVMFATAGGLIFCEVLIKAHAMSPTSLHVVHQVMEGIEAVGLTAVGGLLFAFANKFADLQRNKTILHQSDTVDFIHSTACCAGQALGNAAAIGLAVTPWLVHVPQFWFAGVLLAPAFFYCTTLNIENGVQSAEINGRGEPSPERRAEAQKRVSVMQVLPLGALPSGFAKKAAHGHLPLPAFIALKSLAAGCVAGYIAYQQQPWTKYMRNQKGEFRPIKRADEGTAWGMEWEEVQGDWGSQFLRLKEVQGGSPAADLGDLVGRQLAMCNDEAVTTLALWEEHSVGLQLNLDFHKGKEKEKERTEEELEAISAEAIKVEAT